MQVKDNGKGFNIDGITKKAAFGILGMKERVESLKGNFKLQSSTGMGTKITITIPLVPA